jgi:hypothetical protein
MAERQQTKNDEKYQYRGPTPSQVITTREITATGKSQ